MAVSLLLNAYLETSADTIIIDVRSPGEFQQGHIHNSINIPLLNNEERAIVGTVYKKSGNKEAVLKGFELVGQKFSAYIQEAQKLAVNNKISVYCWRGGMRSNIMAWLFTTAGMQVSLLKGGYKTYRTWALQSFEQERKYLVLGGKTGSGKTEMLQHLQQKGEQVIDLEMLASHRGSAFGAIGQEPQPSNEQFENELAWQLKTFNNSKTIWLENESRLIGKIKIPDLIYDRMRKVKVVEMIVPLELRAKRIGNEYGKFPKEVLAEATQRIEKKLGNLRMKQALEHLQNDALQEWTMMMLEYYDNAYAYGMSVREQDSIIQVEINSEDYKDQAQAIMDCARLIKL